MELFWVKEAQIQGNMPSCLSTGFEITDTGLHYMQNARHADSLSTFNSHVFSNSRPAAFHARLDRFNNTDCFLEKNVEHFNDLIYPLVSWIIPLNRCFVSLFISMILIWAFLSVCELAYPFEIC